MNYKNNPSRTIAIGDHVIGSPENLLVNGKPRTVAGTVVELREATKTEQEKIVVFTVLPTSPAPLTKQSNYQVNDAIGSPENWTYAEDALTPQTPAQK